MQPQVHSPDVRPFGGRVLHAIAHLAFGVGRYVVDTAAEQHRRQPGSVGVVVGVDAEGALRSSPHLVAELADRGVPVFRCGDFFKREAAGLKAAAEELRHVIGTPAERISRPGLIVHAHTAMAATVARWAGAPTVVASFHGWNPNRPVHIELQDAMAFSLADRVLTISAFWAGVLQHKTTIASAAVLPYGVDLERYPARPRAHRDAGGPRVVVAADLVDRMGPDLVLNAMALVWCDLPEAEVHFFGDGPAREKIEALARRLDPAGQRVVFHGAVPDVYARLDEFDVFARANRSDDQPLPIMEAMLAGLPLVGTPVGSLTDWARRSRSGLVVPKDAPRRFAAALKVLLSTGRAGRDELGAAGRRFARATFDIRDHVSRLERLYASDRETIDVVSPLPAGDGPIRLHLGCGPEHRDGWINVDARAAVKPDVVAQADALPMFDDGSVDEIEACHLLEHLPLHEAQRAFREWFRLLKGGGTLHLELPNFDACVRLVGRHQDGQGHDLGMIGVFGWPPSVAEDGVSQVHKWGWTPESLAQALETAGFGTVERESITQTWRPAARVDRDFRVRAVKPQHGQP